MPEIEEWMPIHHPAPDYDTLTTTTEIFETGIKVVDLIEPYVKGGKTGLFGGAEMCIRDRSEAARIESERLLEEYKRQLEEAKSQAAQIVADAKKTGEAVKADMTEKAQAESAAMIEKARAAIEAEKKAAISELQGSVADLSISVASRVIGNDLNDDEHRKIVERYVNEAGSFNAN